MEAVHVVSTPFSQWFEKNEPDPFGDEYRVGLERTAKGHVGHIALANSLSVDIGSKTAAKDRIRWLSRRLMALLEEQGIGLEKYNQARATLTDGQLTDDELANAFFLSNYFEFKDGAVARIRWLSNKIDELENKLAEGVGYIQLWSEAGELVAQRIGRESQMELVRNKVWRVGESDKLLFVNNTDHVHPNKFFKPYLKGRMVTVYGDVERTTPKTEPVGEEVLFTCLVEDFDRKSLNYVRGDMWNAYVAGEWAGTSEY